MSANHSPQSQATRNSIGPALDYALKVDRMQFDAFWHDKLLTYESILGERIPESPRVAPSPAAGAGVNGVGGELDHGRLEEPRYSIERAIIPTEPINAFGIPQATMRCLEVRDLQYTTRIVHSSRART